MNSGTVDRIRNGDQITLALKDPKGRISYFEATITKTIGDIPKCSSCGVRLDSNESHKFGTGYYCTFCYKRKIEQQRIYAQKSVEVKNRKK